MVLKRIEEYKASKLASSQCIREIAFSASSEYILLNTGKLVTFGKFSIERMLQIADDTHAGLLYADYSIIRNDDVIEKHPLIDYQFGSLRDDFDFGPVLLFRTEVLKEITQSMVIDYQFAGLYELRLKISQKYPIVHLNEFLYVEKQADSISTEDKQFAYVDPKNQTVQLEMEAVCSEHLKSIGGYLEPSFNMIHLEEDEFDYEASVIIPVRNREKTIEDAIKSVLEQETTFSFNLIIIDNHSNDGTSEIIRKYAEDRRVIHLIPKETDLNIGGCWNLGVHHPACGKFSVQLDSDDLYANSNVLEAIVNTFYEQQCAMVIGSYKIVDFNLQTIPPGVIEHKEWTPDNGRNNAVRINGLGAPRAFYTPLLRKLNLPDTSYGEDYAIGLRISRDYQIGRIYDVLYLCRRWDGNSDASIDIEKLNRFNTYKDRIRTWELHARINKQK